MESLLQKTTLSWKVWWKVLIKGVAIPLKDDINLGGCWYLHLFVEEIIIRQSDIFSDFKKEGSGESASFRFMWSFLLNLWGRPLSTYAKFSKKIIFLTWCAHVCIRGLELLVFRKILRKYLMDGAFFRYIWTIKRWMTIYKST